MIYSIRTRLNLWFLALIVVIFAGVFLSVRELQRESQENIQTVNEEVLQDFVQSSWEARAEALVHMYSDQLVRAVYAKDLESIRDLAEVAVEQGLANSVFVLDETGMVLSTGSEEYQLYGTLYEDSMRKLEDSRILSAPIIVGSHMLGSVVMEFDTSEMERIKLSLQARMRELSGSAMHASDMRMLLLFAVALVVGLVGSYVIARGLTRPLGLLALAIEKVGRRDGGVVVPQRRDEIGELGRTLVRVDRELRETTISKANLEREVEARTRDLEAKNYELEQANMRLKELDRLKSDFLSSVSHELRTPLTSMLGYSKLIARDARKSDEMLESSPARKGLARIEENAKVIHKETLRLTRLINNVLDLSRIEDGSIEWLDQELDVKEAILQAVTTVRGSAVSNGHVTLRAELPESGLPMLRMDPDKLQQVLVNLLDNAYKFTAEGEIVISAGKAPEGVQISVSDQGVGIAEEHLPGIFERFYQSSRDVLTDKPRGSGLGLAICSEIVSRYGGLISVSSREGQGSTFVVTLPAI